MNSMSAIYGREEERLSLKNEYSLIVKQSFFDCAARWEAQLIDENAW